MKNKYSFTFGINPQNTQYCEIFLGPCKKEVSYIMKTEEFINKSYLIPTTKVTKPYSLIITQGRKYKQQEKESTTILILCSYLCSCSEKLNREGNKKEKERETSNKHICC